MTTSTSCGFIFNSCLQLTTCLFGKIVDWDAWYLLCDHFFLTGRQGYGCHLEVFKKKDLTISTSTTHMCYLTTPATSAVCTEKSTCILSHLHCTYSTVNTSFFSTLILVCKGLFTMGGIYNGRFDVDVPGGPVLKESNSTAPGESLSLIKPIPLSQMILISTFPGWFSQLPVSVSCTKVLWWSFVNLHNNKMWAG